MVIRDLRISWRENEATACYVDRKNHAGTIAGYISIRKNKRDYNITVSGASGSPWESAIFGMEHSRGFISFIGEFLLANMLEAKVLR